MVSRFTRLAAVLKLATIGVLILLLAACGVTSASATNGHGLSAPPVVASPTATPIPRPALAFNSAAAVDMDGLHIQSNGVDCGTWLVLKNPQGTYDSGTLQQFVTYALAFAGNYYLAIASGAEQRTQFTPQFASTLPPLPSTAGEVLPGSVIGSEVGCNEVVTITNTGSNAVQLTSLRAVLTASPVPNATTYRLFDVCTLSDAPGFCQGGFGGLPTCDYGVDLDLHEGSVGTSATGAIRGNPYASGCPAVLTLPASQTVQVRVNINSSSPDLYLVRLSLMLTTSGASTTLNLPPSFNSSLAFTSSNQFACYWLQGDGFKEEQPTDVGWTPDSSYGARDVYGLSFCL